MGLQPQKLKRFLNDTRWRYGQDIPLAMLAYPGCCGRSRAVSLCPLFKYSPNAFSGVELFLYVLQTLPVDTYLTGIVSPEKFPVKEPIMSIAVLNKHSGYTSCWDQIVAKAECATIPIDVVRGFYYARLKYTETRFGRELLDWRRWWSEICVWTHFCKLSSIP
jgi:hypothetical protein